MFIIVACQFIAPKVRVASPLILLVVGLAIVFLPQVGAIEIEPHIVLEMVLPPLLFSAAVRMPTMDFRREMQAVAMLAIPLVFLSAFAVGFVINWLVPAISLPWGVALGAVLSPTDAVAVSIAKRSSASHRIITVLEGEGLFNDATSLVLLSAAMSAGLAADEHALNPGLLIGIDGSAWLYRQVPRAPVTDARTPQDRDLAAGPINGLVAELAAPTSVLIKRRRLNKAGYREIHVLSTIAPSTFTAPQGHPNANLLNDYFSDMRVLHRNLLLGVRLRSSARRGPWRHTVADFVDSMIEGGAALEDWMGDAAATVRRAFAALAALPQTRLLAASSLYRSAPVDASGPDFINAAASVATGLTPLQLLDALQAIETAEGRQRPWRNAPRTLDLDLLLYGQQRLDTPRLTLPHPRMLQRAFVLWPLAEIAPALVPPEALAAVAGQAIERLP